MIATRWSTSADDDGLSQVHRDAWRYAYAGIIPGVTLERMIARRGPRWWRPMHDRGFRALLLEEGAVVCRLVLVQIGDLDVAGSPIRPRDRCAQAPGRFTPAWGLRREAAERDARLAIVRELLSRGQPADPPEGEESGTEAVG